MQTFANKLLKSCTIKMSKSFPFVLSILFSTLLFGQVESTQLDNFQNSFRFKEINGVSVDSLYSIFKNNRAIQIQILSQKEKDYKKVVINNKSNTQYLEVWSSPGGSLGDFFIIGNKKRKRIVKGTQLFPLSKDQFVVNNRLKLGDNKKDIWGKVNLFSFRHFTFNTIEYYYLENGEKHLDASKTPMTILFFKFKNNILIELGFGNGMIGVNPMFTSD